MPISYIFKKRNRKIKSLFRKTNNLSYVGRCFNISRERVRQIVYNIRVIKSVAPYSGGQRVTCYVCRKFLIRDEKKYCNKCIIENKLKSGREFVRGLVRGRDKNTCQICGLQWKIETNKKRLDVHHMDGVCGIKSRKNDKITDSLSKLITLCHKCHIGLHEVRQKISTGMLKNT